MIQKFTILLIVCSLYCIGSAQTIVTKEPLKIGLEYQNDWLTEKWSGDEAPYRKIRDDIDQAFAQKRVTASFKTQYALRAKNAFFNPLERFGEIYLTYKSAVANDAQANKEIYQWPAKFRFIPSPQKYEFARAKFLVAAYCFAHPHFEPIGTRLLQRDPNDIDVKSLMVKILDVRNLKQRKRALAYAQDLRRLQPNSAQPYRSIGWVHFCIWQVTRSKAEGKLAVDNYQKFLRLASPNDPNRTQAHNLITWVKSP